MNKILLHNLAVTGIRAEEPETKDDILRVIRDLALGHFDHLTIETENVKSQASLNLENILKESYYQKNDYVKLSESAVKEAKNKYGTFNKYAKLQLALDFFQMTNDLFFIVYGFNYVPEGKVREAARTLIDSQVTLNTIMTTYANAVPDMTVGRIVNESSVKSLFKDTFRPGC